MAETVTLSCLEEEPPTGSVVAIDWGSPHQEVWVSNRSNLGNWYTTDVPMTGRDHPTWNNVRSRAEGRPLVLLTPGDPDTYAAGFREGITVTVSAVIRAAEDVDVRGPASARTS